MDTENIPVQHAQGMADKSRLESHITHSVLLFVRLACPMESNIEYLIQQMSSNPNTIDTINSFYSDPNKAAVFVHRLLDKKDDSDDSKMNLDSGIDSNKVSLFLSNTVQFSDSLSSVLVIIKRVPFISKTDDLYNQIQYFNIAGFDDGVDLYEAIRNHLHTGVFSIFDAYTSKFNSKLEPLTEHSNSNQRKMAIPTAKKRFAELELSLLQLQHNVTIPIISLDFDPRIVSAVDNAKNEGRKISVDDLGDLILDQGFLNKLQNDMSNWISEIQKVTLLTKNVTSGSTLQEIDFWLSMESSLQDIEDLLKSDYVHLTMDTLKTAKRFHATVSFMTDAGIKEALEKSQKYNILMKDFPIQDLLTANNLLNIKTSISNVLTHVVRKIRLSSYPIHRSLGLMEIISNDFYKQLLSILLDKNLLTMNYTNFQSIFNECMDVFHTWDDECKEFVNTARDLIRKRGEKFIPIKVNAAHAKLRDRIKVIASFRKQHEQLLGTLNDILSSSVLVNKPLSNKSGSTTDSDLANEIKCAYLVIYGVDIYDTSDEGMEKWLLAENKYNERIGHVENMIISTIRERLSVCTSPKQMLSVLSGFNPLFIRQRISISIKEYQMQLVEDVKDKINLLQQKIKTGYPNTNASEWTKSRGITDVAGALMWNKQLEKQLDLQLNRIAQILGAEWEKIPEGQRILVECHTIRKRLDRKPIVDNWLSDLSEKQLSISGPIFRKSNKPNDFININVLFDKELLCIAKEIKFIQSMGYPLPYALSVFSKACYKSFPYATSLSESLKIYKYIKDTLLSNDIVSSLVEENFREIEQLISDNIDITWESIHNGNNNTNSEMITDDNVGFISMLWQLVDILRSRSTLALESYTEIIKNLESLQDTDFNFDKMKNIILYIQRLLNGINSNGFDNYIQVCTFVDDKIVNILESKFQVYVSLWLKWFKDGFESINSKRPRGYKGFTKEQYKFLESKFVEFSPIDLEIKIRNQFIYSEPPLENIRSKWSGSLKSWINRLITLPRIKINNVTKVEAAYDEIVIRCGNILTTCFESIGSKYELLYYFVNKIFKYQILWEVTFDNLSNVLGNEIGKWETMLNEFKDVKSMIDNTDGTRQFGNTTVYYKQVQSKVKLRYTSLQQETVTFFGTMLHNSARGLYKTVSDSRYKIETFSQEALHNLSEIINLLTTVKSFRSNINCWNIKLNQIRSGEVILQRNKYVFPNDWLTAENLDAQWDSLQVALSDKENMVKQNLHDFQKYAIREISEFNKEIDMIKDNWQKLKPTDGGIDPKEAFRILDEFSMAVNELDKRSKSLSIARDTLSLNSISFQTTEFLMDEVNDLKYVWKCISGVYDSVGTIKDQLWISLDLSRLGTQTKELLTSLQSSSMDVRQYSAYEHTVDVLKEVIDVLPVLKLLKYDSMKSRHWETLLEKLGMPKQVNMNKMKLVDILDLRPSENLKVIESVISIAQGEMALEDFILNVRSVWSKYSLEFITYQDKIVLIKSWEDLFSKCNNHLSAISSMKHSPFYKFFEEEGILWESKLNKILVLFDAWHDVQRQWVYLDGIFSTNTEIKLLLPNESNKFDNLSLEFLSLMKRVSKSKHVLDVISIPGIDSTIERIADYLAKTKKSLGDYLERERDIFPRFYFISNEDLLEILGNNNDIERVQVHLRKMFPGIGSIVIEDVVEMQNVPVFDVVSQSSRTPKQIVGIKSIEGECFTLCNPIKIEVNTAINDWLTRLENEISYTLAYLLELSIQHAGGVFDIVLSDDLELMKFISAVPIQITILALQVHWTQQVELAIKSKNVAKFIDLETKYSMLLTKISQLVLKNVDLIIRKSLESIIIELVHFRDTIRNLKKSNVQSISDPLWSFCMRFYHDTTVSDIRQSIKICMADSTTLYNFEYLGIGERLVQTPLTDKCYLTLTQALTLKMGGCPYGPAGTGKTESVKALGRQLGRLVIVFCCDESFDFESMDRIILGLSRIGAWSCFDEFNRLEENILSAVSQQIQSVQMGLKLGQTASLYGKSTMVHQNTGLFVTMNPDYSGRSSLPDNLKKLFRSISMSKPNIEMIIQVIMYSQGFTNGESLAQKLVSLFKDCQQNMSVQDHYDFGLRALKTVVVNAGNLKRGKFESTMKVTEDLLIVRSIKETIVPQLVQDDIEIIDKLIDIKFEGIKYKFADIDALHAALIETCEANNILPTPIHLRKMCELYQLQNVHHGVMLVGSTGCGKTTVINAVLDSMEKLSKTSNVIYRIDAKAITKDELYGHLDIITREWTDGLFTSIMRKIVNNTRNEDSKMHWIIFDGDIDPEWVENLNSVLDDNKTLTLPNGERIGLSKNIRILFEVSSVKHATLATVSRCRMVCFSDNVTTASNMLDKFVKNLESLPLKYNGNTDNDVLTRNIVLQVQISFADVLRPHIGPTGFIMELLDISLKSQHIMEMLTIRAIETLISILTAKLSNFFEHLSSSTTIDLNHDELNSYFIKMLAQSICWAFMGDSTTEVKNEFSKNLVNLLPMNDRPPNSVSIFDCYCDYNGQWHHWKDKVPTVDIGINQLTRGDTIIPTIDTVKHEDFIFTMLSAHKPLILCGPPGSGKTMSIFNSLKNIPNMELVGLNFSSGTTQELILKTLMQYCNLKKTAEGITVSPRQSDSWLVLFCDEINLPREDKYGTVVVISFLRQIVEYGGFWSAVEKSWVKLERIQLVAACNPSTDAGRSILSARFTRHTSIVYVGYPQEQSLRQIYSTFSKAVMKEVGLIDLCDQLSNAMIEVYMKAKAEFTQDIECHYIFSPRELTRWIKGIHHALNNYTTVKLQDVKLVWLHEGLRLFRDRLVSSKHSDRMDDILYDTSNKYFNDGNLLDKNNDDILFTRWLSGNYTIVDRKDLLKFTQDKLSQFREEVTNLNLILYDDFIDHMLHIDRVFWQPQGHMLLIGPSGNGKKTMVKFVAWINNIKVINIHAHRNYSDEDFANDLRSALFLAGAKGSKVCVLIKISESMNTSRLELMNTLLANAEIPGLFEGDNFTSLMSACKERAQLQGDVLTSDDDTYKWFRMQIVNNLHIVLTMSPPKDGLGTAAKTSPALINRCVLNWHNTWSEEALIQAGTELSSGFNLYDSNKSINDMSCKNLIVKSFVSIHNLSNNLNRMKKKMNEQCIEISPRTYMNFIDLFGKLLKEQSERLEYRHGHLQVGLNKLRETLHTVEKLQSELAVKRGALETKTSEANNKLQIMISKQQEAEGKKMSSMSIKAALQRQKEEIAKRRAAALSELAEVEPAVETALNSVSSINKQQLTELRSMQNPPETIKMSLEAVLLLLGTRTNSWKEVQSMIRKDDFIQTVINFDSSTISASTCKLIFDNYMSKENFSFAVANRASKACGPLVQWAIAQVNYITILNRVEPLRLEVEQLEVTSAETLIQVEENDKLIVKLERSISQYKEEYAGLISESQLLKSETESVELKVNRSVQLLNDLETERSRWEEGLANFDSQKVTLVGDTMLCAAYIIYSGYYDELTRKKLFSLWTKSLDEKEIRYKSGLSFSSYLSIVDDRTLWTNKGLPNDSVSIDNTVMMKHLKGVPLLIDPAGQALKFLKNMYSSLIVTSFTSPMFLKTIENCLRLGIPVIIKDAENYDSIIENVINKEYKQKDGRTLVSLGDQDIDISPNFKMFIYTQSSSTVFNGNICSRVTFVNFTITQASLQNQLIDIILSNERPEVNKRRIELQKSQGEFQLRLQTLEESLLDALNNSKESILNDDNVVSTLVSLKKEVAEITLKMSDTGSMLKEVEKVTQMYLPLCKHSSSLYFLLDKFKSFENYYQFSLQFFLDIINHCVASIKTNSSIMNPRLRLDKLVKSIFVELTIRASRSLNEIHKTVLILHACKCMIDTCGGFIKERTWSSLIMPLSKDNFGIDNSMDIDGSSPLLNEESLTKVNKFFGTKYASRIVSYLLQISPNEQVLQKILYKLITNVKHINECIKHPYRIMEIEELNDVFGQYSRMEENKGDNSKMEMDNEQANTYSVGSKSSLLDRAVFIKYVRPDEFAECIQRISSEILYDSKSLISDHKASLKRMIEEEIGRSQVTNSTAVPIILGSLTNHEGSKMIEELAEQLKTQFSSISMGSTESITIAEKAIKECIFTGGWVLLKNAHYSLDWLVGLEKKFGELNDSSKNNGKAIIHQDFRIMVTLNLSNKIPNSILLSGRMILIEQEPTIKANLLRGLNNLISNHTDFIKAPIEKNRIYLSAIWMHSIVVGRLRYIPNGWSRSYEFNETDLDITIKTINDWVNRIYKSSAIVPDTIPWSSIRKLICESIYGGKVDNNSVDSELLNTLANFFFNEHIFGAKFNINSYVTYLSSKMSNSTISTISSADHIILPDVTSIKDLIEWVSNSMPEEDISWLCLPESSELIRKTKLSESIFTELNKFKQKLI